MENVIFFNSHADDSYCSEQYKPVTCMDENRIASEYVIVDANGQKMPMFGQMQVFKSFEKKLNDMSLYQKHKFYKKYQSELDGQIHGNYKFQHPLRTRYIDRANVLNRQYYNAFANGHENTSTKGINPYSFDIF